MDPFDGLPTTLTTPARDAQAIAPSDTVALTIMPRAVYVGVAGNLAALMPGGQTVVFQGVAAGTLLPIRAARVNATGTTAGGLIALW
jgi:predicted short-subunit dehydrogenase-like oxidoreductase (DUF2520 family)